MVVSAGELLVAFAAFLFGGSLSEMILKAGVIATLAIALLTHVLSRWGDQVSPPLGFAMILTGVLFWGAAIVVFVKIL